MLSTTRWDSVRVFVTAVNLVVTHDTHMDIHAEQIGVPTTRTYTYSKKCASTPPVQILCCHMLYDSNTSSSTPDVAILALSISNNSSSTSKCSSST